MSRLTGNIALGLFEAYQAVYAPRQELTENQLWEEVEYWVNSLLEDGYDLSDYTWEEMYESYGSYNTVVCHLLDEGYANSLETAIVIMTNMSEEWRNSIVEANRGDEHATRGMSPDDARKYKETRRNAHFVSNKPAAMRNYYGGHSSSELNDMRGGQKPKKKPLPSSAGYDPKTGTRDINKTPMGKYETMLDKKINPQRHKGYYG